MRAQCVGFDATPFLLASALMHIRLFAPAAGWKPCGTQKKHSRARVSPPPVKLTSYRKTPAQAVVAGAVEKTKAKRFASARAMRHALEDAMVRSGARAGLRHYFRGHRHEDTPPHHSGAASQQQVKVQSSWHQQVSESVARGARLQARGSSTCSSRTVWTRTRTVRSACTT